MKPYDTSIPYDETVYAVVYTHDEIGPVWMPEVARTRAEARNHWRFTARWLSADDISRTQIVELTHREFIEKAYRSSPSANPFEGIKRLDFYKEMRERWGTGAKESA